MRNFPRLLLHVFERIGLSLAGASVGLFVGIQTGSSIPALTNATFLLVMTVIGAIGFYLGIDTPAHRFRAILVDLPGRTLDGRIDVSEVLTAIGTLLASLAAFISVAMIVLVFDSSAPWATALLAVWCLGAVMQVAAGTTARWQR